VLAATGRCTASGQDCRFGVYTSRMGSTTWRPIPAATARGVEAPSLFVAGRTAYLASNVPLRGSLNYAAGLAGAGSGLLAAATSNTTGYATQWGVYRHQLWLTSDGGRRWRPITIR
jgi:hypothetical protein